MTRRDTAAEGEGFSFLLLYDGKGCCKIQLTVTAE